ncbi:WhiB family transcriptional regulator [Streptomyces lavendulocolor]|uniref:WhiB family transcriptional regulator n=1 Tax=Streptomyces lavendulocolor TaxID=67316 RepID=UPI0033C03C5F
MRTGSRCCRRLLQYRYPDDALCAQTDPELFHPEKGGTTAYAKRICLACEVRIECLEHALANGELHGVWGGMGPDQRKAIRRARDRRRTA